MSSDSSEQPLHLAGGSPGTSSPTKSFNTFEDTDSLQGPSSPVHSTLLHTAELAHPSPIASPHRLIRENSLPVLSGFVLGDQTSDVEPNIPYLPSPPKASFNPRRSSSPAVSQRAAPKSAIPRSSSLSDIGNKPSSAAPSPSATPTKSYARSLASASIAPSQRQQRHSDTTWVNDVDKYSLMIKHIHEQCGKNHWLPTDPSYTGSVVALRASESTNTINGYKCYPAAGPRDIFLTAATTLNVEVAICIFSHVVEVIISSLPADTWDFPLRDDTRVQIIHRIQDLPRARKHQYAAFVREQKCLVVWSDSASKVVEQGEELEKKIFDFIWNDGDGVGRYEQKKPKVGGLEELESGNLGLRRIAKRKRALLQAILVGMVCLDLAYSDL